jgi:hypothetical protein
MIIYNPSHAMPRYVIHFGQVRSWQNDPTYLPGKALETAAQIKAALDAALAPLVTPANYIVRKEGRVRRRFWALYFSIIF